MGRRRAAHIGIGAVAIAACLLSSTSAHAARSAVHVGYSTQVFAVGGGGGVRRLTRGPESHSTPVWSPDGRMFVTVGLDVEVRARDGRLLHSFPTQVWDQDPSISWSPDGRRLAFITVRTEHRVFRLRLVTASLDGTHRRVLVRRHVEGPPSWSPDGRTIYFTRSGGIASIWKVATHGGSPRKLISDAHSPRVSPDGRWLLYHSFAPTNGLTIARPDGGGQRALVRETFAAPWGWVPNRARVFFVRHDRNGYHLRVVSPSGTVRKLGATLPATEQLAWSPDRRRVAWTAGGNAEDLVVRSSRTDGTHLRTLARFTSKSQSTESDSLSWSPGGQILVAVHRHIGD
jgi:Tol biopolymer transport system component